MKVKCDTMLLTTMMALMTVDFLREIEGPIQGTREGGVNGS
jgi:hypothetical protein